MDRVRRITLLIKYIINIRRDFLAGIEKVKVDGILK